MSSAQSLGITSQAPDKLVEVTVGKTPYDCTWRLDRQILCKKSVFFRTALDGRFKEAHDNCVLLPENDVHVFEFFLDWLAEGSSALSKVLPSDCDTLLPQIWVFGEKVGAKSFQNAAMEALLKRYNGERRGTPPTQQELTFVYANTLNDSRLCHVYDYIVRFHAASAARRLKKAWEWDLAACRRRVDSMFKHAEALRYMETEG
ncbi:hypothetical protein LTS18_005907 [Coniosporium uncinatum]|uniref:Uncharacterized protein n=1 Tax=Coniosporium uncinatum TaxID=93489 RepID=A0ACC3DQM7_9PEZI|nr:hypothetical protein LTS18_005907 [Coniosporium uncinatum]